MAIEALNFLELNYNIESLKKVKLFGRFYPILSNVTIDVGHNLLAAKAIVRTLKLRQDNKKPILIYNSLSDKPYEIILKTFAPYVKRVEVIAIQNIRSVDLLDLTKVLEGLSVPFKEFKSIQEDEEYLVFGSFYVVEAFLKSINIKN